MKHRLFLLRLQFALVAASIFSALLFLSAGAQQPVVRAVLFYSPTCPHCHKVIQDVLPPLVEKYGDQLQIIAIDVTKQAGAVLFKTAIDTLSPEKPAYVVPTLIVGEYILVGSNNIPAQFPGLIEMYLAQGGVDWPPIPGLQEALEAAQIQKPQATPGATSQVTAAAFPTVTATMPVATLTVTPSPSVDVQQMAQIQHLDQVGPPAPLDMNANFNRDLTGSILALLVLIGMLTAVCLGGIAALRPTLVRLSWRKWAIPLLALAGLGVAAYLAFVETAEVTAICGPVGDCNAVQQSEYARLFGIPIGVLGVVGYSAILVVWAVGLLKSRFAAWAALALLAMTFGGTLFSIYLTFLEPFVIGAVCAWCLTSAVLITLLFVLSIPFYWSRRLGEAV